MTSKREYRKIADANYQNYTNTHDALREEGDKVDKLEVDVEIATTALESATAHANLHAANEQALTDFLGSLLILEPSLHRFALGHDEHTDTPIWDLDGAAIAADHVVARELAVAYADVSEGAGA